MTGSLYSDWLCHHGVAGQKWGVKNGPPYPLDKRKKDRVYKNRKYVDDMNEIVDTLSDEQKEKLGASKHEKWVEPEIENEYLTTIQKVFETKVDDIPVAFLELSVNDSKREGQVAIATRNDGDYQGKGYASDLAAQMNKWLNRYGKTSMDEVVWWAREDNTPSRKIAEKAGFIDSGRDTDPDGTPFVRYSKKLT